MDFRVGQGYDVHKIAKGENLILGGVKINYSKGAVAHSDGDVLIHAIIDSILGAANLGDIGQIFPDNDLKYKDIDSKILLTKTAELLRKSNFEINNIDSTIVLQKPKIAKYIPKMKNALSNALTIDVNRISIKATTTEELGFEGKEEGISAQSACLIYKK